MKEYTQKEHAQRLLKMLKKKNPCGCCPAGLYFKGYVTASNKNRFIKGLDFDDVCPICLNFVGIKDNYCERNCPCNELGKERAIKQTWLRLKELGYLE
jgi:hypothetical protein